MKNWVNLMENEEKVQFLVTFFVVGRVVTHNCCNFAVGNENRAITDM